MNHLRLLLGLFCGAATSLAAAPAWDTFSDTWTAIDALGRPLPSASETGPPRAGKQVGIFYFLWLGRHGSDGPFDISRILARNPDAIRDPSDPAWGPLFVPHHWGESLFGYYVGEDEAVLAKHAQMLADAGIDAVIFDVTNQLTYPDSWRALCRVWDRIRQSGQRVPQIAFLCPFGDPARVVRELYHDLYGPGLYPELWFRWDGKPLILAEPAALRPTGGKPRADRAAPSAADDETSAILQTFTFRKPQPDYFRGPTGPDQWGWLEVAPQHAFTNRAGQIEEVTVGVAQNAVDGRLSVLSNPRSHGRSFQNGREPGPDAYDATGRNFAEQWRRAFELDPPFVFVTGWNEWIAGRFTTNSGFHADAPVTFVDQFNAEFSRDIEPMRGGHGDNYYYQLVSQVRRFKGARPVEPVRPAPIRVDGRFADWTAVQPEFRDTRHDPVHRDQVGWDRKTRYLDDTGRNDIELAQVSWDRKNLYCHARTREPLTAPAGTNWMLLLLDLDGNATNGWLGYDVLINRSRASENRVTVECHTGSGFNWRHVGEAPMRFAGADLELAVPWRMVGLRKPPVRFGFKWADNCIQDGAATDLTVHGDAAPNDRFNYQAVLRPRL